jgi:hypothetical protein
MNSGGSSTASDNVTKNTKEAHMNKIWTGKTYEITQRYPVAGDLWLVDTSGANMTFELIPDSGLPDLLNLGGQRYKVTSSENHMKPIWKHAWLGEVDTAPAWVLGRMRDWLARYPEIKGTQGGALRPFFEQIASGKVSSQYPCLHGLMAVDYPPGSPEPRCDFVTMFYFEKTNSSATDLIYVHFCFGDEQFYVEENGGGSGPPH